MVQMSRRNNSRFLVVDFFARCRGSCGSQQGFWQVVVGLEQWLNRCECEAVLYLIIREVGKGITPHIARRVANNGLAEKVCSFIGVGGMLLGPRGVSEARGITGDRGYRGEEKGGIGEGRDIVVVVQKPSSHWL